MANFYEDTLPMIFKGFIIGNFNEKFQNINEFIELYATLRNQSLFSERILSRKQLT